MTTTTNIEAVAMSDEQEFNAQMTELAEPFWLKDSMKQGEFFDVNGFARALLASKPAMPWIAHWAGSNPYKGWSIRCGRDEIVWFGETVSSETVEAIVLAHNKCFDCDGTGCVMNCSGLRSPAPASPSGEDAAEQSAAPMAGPKMPNGFQISCDPLSAVEACINDYEQEKETPVSNAILSGLYKARQVLTLPRAAEQADEAVTLPQLKPRLLNQLRRFNECCEDSEADGHDVDHEDMHSLAEIGAVRPAPFGRHYMTDFGHYLLAAHAKDSK